MQLHRQGSARSGRAWRTGIGLIAVALMAVSCGASGDETGAEGGDAESPEDATEAPTTPEPTATTAGSGEDWAAIEEAARQEGEVVLYVTAPGVEDALRSGFGEAYPEISLEIVRAPAGDIIPRLDQERDSGADGADVVVHSDLGWFTEHASRFKELDGPAVEELWQGNEALFQDGKYAVASYISLFIGVNPDVVSEVGAQPVEGFGDLAQPELEGLIGITPPALSNVNLQYWYEVSQATPDGFMEQLADIGLVDYPSTAPLGQAVAAGELAVGAYTLLIATAEQRAAGAPLELVPGDPAMGVGQFLGVPDWAHRPNAGMVFAHWLLSQDGQIAMNGAGHSHSALPLDALGDVPDTMVELPEGFVLLDGVATEEQQTWHEDVWTPLFGE